MAFIHLKPSVESSEAIRVVCILGLASVVLALLYTLIRRRVYGVSHTLDSTLEAGGRVSTTLTAVSLAGQLLWPSGLLHSATDSAKAGVSGGLWYPLPITITILLFPVMTLQLKSRAPGAKTYLQLIQARFGRNTHLLYCVVALLTNALITASVVVTGTAMFNVIVKDTSDEMVVMAIAALFGSCAFVGGLGATFYVCFFNVVIILCVLWYFIFKIFYVTHDGLAVGNISQNLESLIQPGGLTHQGQNDFGKDPSYLAFWSSESLMNAVKGTLLCLPVVFCDQATWQNKIAAKPLQGVFGFFVASFVLLAVLTAIGTSVGVAYLTFSGVLANDGIITTAGNSSVYNFLYHGNRNISGADVGDVISKTGTWLLSAEDVSGGLVTPLIADLALGRHAGIALVIIVTALFVSTGSREVMAVSSIVVYDFYQTYVQPFRASNKKGHCVLCDRPRLGEVTDTIFIDENDIYCCCPPLEQCRDCESERKWVSMVDQETVLYQVYTCPIHGQYKAYQDSLLLLQRWVVLWVTLGVIPVGLLVMTSGLGLTSILTYGALVTLPALPGIVFCTSWVKATSQGLIAGSISGMICGVCANLACAANLAGNLDNFLANTQDDVAVVAGTGTCLAVSLCVTVVVSLRTHPIRTPADADREWQKLRDIDNPLYPWQQNLRKRELTSPGGRRPTYQELEKRNRFAKTSACVGSLLLLATVTIIIPASLASRNTLTSSDLLCWLRTLHISYLVTSALVVILTPVEEIWGIWCALNKNRTVKIAEKRQGNPYTDTTLETEQREVLILK